MSAYSPAPEGGYRAPSECPVCGSGLTTTRLGCHTCGTEIGGQFRACDFCRLDEAKLSLLQVFLASRGNLREVAKHLGVSYPTARVRLTELLDELGLAGADDLDEAAATESSSRAAADSAEWDDVLARVEAGSLSPDVAARILGL